MTTGLTEHTHLSQQWDILESNQSSVWRFAPCDHPATFGDLCTVCGKSIEQSSGDGSAALGGTKRSAPAHSAAAASSQLTFQAREGYELNLSKNQAAKLDARKHAWLRERRRLTLTLDLDHTLIHSTNDPQYAHLVGHPALVDAPMHTFMLCGKRYFTKERPGLKAFLRAAKEHFELQVDTAGTRPYALEIVAAIDPDGEFFGSDPRIVTRTDSGKLSKQTSWLHGSLLDDSMVVALDDTEAVWRGSPVLLVVDPYHYFQGTKEVNNAAGASVALPSAAGEAEGAPPAAAEHAAVVPSPHGIEEQRLHLLDALKVFNTVHRAYFSCYGVDIPASKYQHGVVTHALDSATAAGLAMLSASQRAESTDHLMHAAYLMQRFCQTILRGVVIVFSGVFPLGTDARKEVLFRRAVAFGATVADAVSEKVTHVVCRAYGTAKTRQAEKLKVVRVVQVAWLQDCIRQYRRVPEGPYVPAAAKAAGCGSKPHPHSADSAKRADAHFDKYFASMLHSWRQKQQSFLQPAGAAAEQPDEALQQGDAKRSRVQFADEVQHAEDDSGGEEVDMDMLAAALDDSDGDSQGGGEAHADDSTPQQTATGDADSEGREGDTGGWDDGTAGHAKRPHWLDGDEEGGFEDIGGDHDDGDSYEDGGYGDDGDEEGGEYD